MFTTKITEIDFKEKDAKIFIIFESHRFFNCHVLPLVNKVVLLLGGKKFSICPFSSTESKILIQETRRCEFKSRSRQRIFRFPTVQCQINMNLVFHISEDGSDIELKHCVSSKTSVIRHENISFT